MLANVIILTSFHDQLDWALSVSTNIKISPSIERKRKMCEMQLKRTTNESDDYRDGRETISYARSDADVRRIGVAVSHMGARDRRQRETRAGAERRSICSPPKIHARTYGGGYPTFSVPGLRDTKRGNCTHSGPESDGGLKEGSRRGERER